MAEKQTVNEFKTDAHRRVAANLAQPRSVLDLARFLQANDPHVGRQDPKIYDPEHLGEYLKDLEAEGLVKNLGAIQVPKSALAEAEGDEDLEDELAQAAAGEELVTKIEGDAKLPTLHKEKASALFERASNPQKFPRAHKEEQWYFTQEALDRLNGSIPDEPPPKEGPDLRAAKKQQRAVADQDKQIVKDARKAEVERRKKALDEAEKAAKEAEE